MGNGEVIPIRKGIKTQKQGITKQDLEAKVLLSLTSKSKELAELNSVDAFINNYDDVEMLRSLAEKAGLDRTILNRIGSHQIRVIRAAGSLSETLGRAKGAKMTGLDTMSRPVNKRTDDDAPTAQELGYSGTKQRQRWEMVSKKKLPDNLFLGYEEKVLSNTKKTDKIICAAGLFAVAKKYQNTLSKEKACTPTEAYITHKSWQDWLPKQPKCDLLLTDPPYSTDVDDIAEFAAEWLPVALEKVKPTGRAYVCIGAYPIELHSYLSVPPPKHLTLNQVLVWTYRNTMGPSPRNDYKMNWQAILYYVGVNAPPLNCPKMTEQFSVQDINAPDARHDDNPEMARWHAWQKPDALCERFVRHASKEGDLILDPFAGTGSFILAAARLGRRALGCDRSEEMVAIAKKRGCKSK